MPETAAREIPATFADVEVNFAKYLPGYEPRVPQQRMAAAIENALKQGRSLYVQAGCGTGKSLGGVTPALLQALHQGQRVIVATATKALQEQYATKDIPFLEEKSGIPFTWAVVKGRSNYACWAKLNSDDLERDETAEAIKAEVAADPEHSGDREHFDVEIDNYTWSKMASSSNECPGKSKCPFGEICFAEKAKRKGLDADLVVTNQAMLMVDVVLQSKTRGENTAGIQMLGDRGVILFDEGHELPEYAANALGKEFTPRGVSMLFRDALTFAMLYDTDLTDRADACSKIMNDLDSLIFPLLGEVRKESQAVTLNWFAENFEVFDQLNSLLKSLYLDLAGVKVGGDDKQQAKLKLLQARVENLLETVEELVLSEDHERVRWIEGYTVKDMDYWRMKIAPVEVGPFLKANLWDTTPSIVMSATLSAGQDRRGNKDFSYIKRTLGLWDADTVDVGSPFDLGRQGLMFVPAPSVPEPKQYAAWAGYAVQTTLNLIDASKGGALLLYTSRNAMKAAYEELAPRLENRGLTTLMQGDGRTNKQLAQIFKEDEHSVLFALKSFFVGVDVPGNACRLVVVDKMPFPVPSDPVFKARTLLEERAGRRSFATLSVPMMTLSLEQAVGRLIRTKDDSGIVAILDSRLTSKGYGRDIVRSLPDFPVTTELTDVQRFYNGERFGRTA